MYDSGAISDLSLLPITTVSNEGWLLHLNTARSQRQHHGLCYVLLVIEGLKSIVVCTYFDEEATATTILYIAPNIGVLNPWCYGACEL